jgi:hypothetical protein
MFYPSNHFKSMVWDIAITLCLLVSCILTPFNIAFSDNLDGILWYSTLNYLIDFCFLIDIVINFNTAIIDEEFKVIDDRKAIAMHYITGWFFIDLVSIVPFESLSMLIYLEDGQDEGMGSTKANQLIRIARISKLYKLAKIVKLLRLIKIAKKKREISQRVMAVVKTGAAIDRVVFFIMMLLLMCHLIGCLFIFMG